MSQLESILKEDGALAIKFSGKSMLTLLRDADTLIVHQRRLSEIKIGDIGVFKNKKDARYIAHRVIGKRNNALISKGDSSLLNIDADFVLPEDLLGIVACLYRQGRLVNIPKVKTWHKFYYYLLIALRQDKFLKPMLNFARRNYILSSFARFIWRLRYRQIAKISLT